MVSGVVAVERQIVEVLVVVGLDGERPDRVAYMADFAIEEVEVHSQTVAFVVDMAEGSLLVAALATLAFAAVAS